MAGHYLNKSKQYSLLLQKWIENTIHDKLWEKYSDLHINEVDSFFEKKNHWLDGSIFLLNIAINLIDRNNYSVLLAIPLSYSLKATNYNFINKEYINKNLSDTPPSFYMYPIGAKSFENTIDSSALLMNISSNLGLNVFYKEVEEDEEYFRTIFIKYPFKFE